MPNPCKAGSNTAAMSSNEAPTTSKGCCRTARFQPGNNCHSNQGSGPVVSNTQRSASCCNTKQLLKPLADTRIKLEPGEKTPTGTSVASNCINNCCKNLPRPTPRGLQWRSIASIQIGSSQSSTRLAKGDCFSTKRPCSLRRSLPPLASIKANLAQLSLHYAAIRHYWNLVLLPWNEHLPQGRLRHRQLHWLHSSQRFQNLSGYLPCHGQSSQ